jgi:RNA-directed DNA polymerase
MELPPYFVFNKVLWDIEKSFSGELTLNDLTAAKKNETVNHILYGNKDGKYAWRKYEIINPLIYVSLVNIITEKNNWRILQERFKEFQKDKNIECESIPVLPSSRSKQKAIQISQWVNNIEKKSIILSLQYNFLYQTDITDCYESLYTHSLPWAIHTKAISKKKKMYNDLFGNKIDHHIQAMSFGQTNGIPQGSILMDFLAEIVLGYADYELSKKLKLVFKDKIFHILRYRDDYRIFVNDISDGDKILKCLGEVLLNLGFRLNTNKTYFDEDVVSGSIKKDKMDALKFENVPKKLSKKELLRQLLIVQQVGKQFPNSGTLKNRLSKILDVIKPKDFYNQQRVIASVLIDIAYNNPDTFPIIAGLISNCIAELSYKRQKEIITLIQSKICTLTNIGLLEIWTQRMSIGLKYKLNFNEKLCKSVYDTSQQIFETNWIKDIKIKNIIDGNVYIDKKRISRTKTKIENKEVQIFSPYYN